MTDAFSTREFPPAPEAPTNGTARVVDGGTYEVLSVRPDPTPDPPELVLPLKPHTEFPIPTISDPPVTTPTPPTKSKRTYKLLSLEAIGTLVFALLIVFAIMAASFIASFQAILSAAAYTGIPDEWLWTFPVLIDFAIFGYTINLLIFQRRGKPVKRTIFGLIFFATLSVLTNFVHTYVFWDGQLTTIQAWMGVVLAVAAPVAVLLASEEVSRLAFEGPDD